MITTYIGLGSNLSNPLAQLQRATRALADIEQSQLRKLSSVWSSPPMGPADQPDYLNAVAELATDLNPLDLLDALQAIEENHGRVRGRRWGERTLDLDLLLYGSQSIEHPRLQVPHPGLGIRAFVLYPLAEIAGDLYLPDGRSVASLRTACDADGLSRLNTVSLPEHKDFATSHD